MRKELKRRAEKNLETSISLAGIAHSIHLSAAKTMRRGKKELLREREIIGKKDIHALLFIYEKWRKRKNQ